MMNLIALSLIATSFLVSGLFSPAPHHIDPTKEQVIVREGHRAVVVEYADTAGDGNTKVSISPPRPTTATALEEDQLSKAAASVAGVAQDAKGKAKEVVTGGRPRELICDAYGKCKHKVAGVLGRAKEKAVGAEEVVEEAVDKAKDFATRTTHGVSETAEDVKEMAKDKGREVKDFASRTGHKASETAEDVKEMAKDKAKEAKDFASRTGHKASETAEGVKEMVKDKAKETGEMVEGTKEKVKEKGRKGKEELSGILRRGKEVVGYVFGADSMGALLNLMGLAMAYGIGTWVTFISSYVLAGILPRQQFGMVQSKMYPVYFKAMAASIGLALLGHLLGNRGKVFKSMPEVLQGYNLLSSLLFVLVNLLFLEPRATKVLFERMKLEKEEGRGRGGHVGAPTRVIDTVVTDSAGPIPTATTTTTTGTITDATTTQRRDRDAAKSGATADATTTTVTTSTQGHNRDAAKSKLANLDEKLRKLNSYSSLLNTMTLMGLTWHLVYLSQRVEVNSCDSGHGAY